jgi:hypothetical protein
VVWSFSSLDKRTVAPGIRDGMDVDDGAVEMYLRYADWFAVLVGQAATEGRRKEILNGLPRAKPGQVTQLRHRWDPSEVERICQMLKAGRMNWDRIPRIQADGRELADLRGIVTRGPVFGHPDDPADRRPVLRDIDFSYARVDLPAGSFADVMAEDCRFVGTDFLQEVVGRFVRCDCTRMVQHNGWLKGEFVDCRFAGADLSRCIVGDRFVRCDFSAADLTRAEFHGTFEDCRWEACRVGYGTCLPSSAAGAPA